MSSRHNKKKKQQEIRQTAVDRMNQPTTEIKCQEHPDRRTDKVTADSFPIYKPPDSKVAVWTLFVGVIVATIYFLQLLAMQDTVKKLETQTRLSVRPWVGLDEGGPIETMSPLQIDKTGTAQIVYKIRAKNYSTSPASNVWATANLVLADDLNTVYEQQTSACGDTMIGKPDIGQVLFQGKDRTFNETTSFAKIILKHENSIIGVWLAGCIGYRDQFNYLCRTKFIWGFSPDDPVQAAALQSKPVPALTLAGHFVPTASGNFIDTCQIPKYK